MVVVPGPVLIVLDKACFTMLWHGSPWGPSSAGSVDSPTFGNTLTAQPQPRAELDSTLYSMRSDLCIPTRAHDPRKNSSSFILKNLSLGMTVLIHLQGCTQLCAIYLIVCVPRTSNEWSTNLPLTTGCPVSVWRRLRGEDSG